MAAQVQTPFNDGHLLYDELHQMYPEVAENDIMRLMKENGYDRAKCLAALVHKSNQVLYGDDTVITTTVSTHIADQLANLRLPASPAGQPCSPGGGDHNYQLTDATNRRTNESSLVNRQMTSYNRDTTYYAARYVPAVSANQEPQFSPPTKPQISVGQAPHYVSQIAVNAQNSVGGTEQRGYMPPPHHPPSSLPHFDQHSPGTCAVGRQPVSLQIHRNNAPASPASSTHHRDVLVERPGQFSQPFPGGATVSYLGGGDRQRQLYTPPPESYPLNQRPYVQQSPSALQHPSPLSQTPPTPSSSRYCATTYIQVSPVDQNRHSPYPQPHMTPTIAPTYHTSRDAPSPWHPFDRSPQPNFLTSSEAAEADRMRQQHFQPAASPAIRDQPHFQPAALPVIRDQQHFQPAASPAIRDQPHFQPAASPAIRDQPHFQPAASPAIRDQQHFQPAASPAIRDQPHFQPAASPAIRDQQHFQPAASPAIRDQQHFQPAASPAIRDQQHFQPAASPAIRDVAHPMLQPEGVGPVPLPLPGDGKVRTSEDAYMQTLLQYQAQRKYKMEHDMSDSNFQLKQLRSDVGCMEQEQLRRRRHSRSLSFPQTHDMQAIRERNRTLQVDIKIMAAQVDMVTNGQSPLGILDPQEQQRFYSHINTGQQGPINQPQFMPTPPPHHSLHQHVNPMPYPPPYAPPYLPPSVNPMPMPAPVPSDDMAQWSCSACTFLNHPQLDKCEVCEMPRISVGFT